MTLDDEIDMWKMFHETLRKESAELFGQMFDEVKEYGKAIESHPKPTEAFLLALMLKNQKRIEKLKEENKKID